MVEIGEEIPETMIHIDRDHDPDQEIEIETEIGGEQGHTQALSHGRDHHHRNPGDDEVHHRTTRGIGIETRDDVSKLEILHTTFIMSSTLF